LNLLVVEATTGKDGGEEVEEEEDEGEEGVKADVFVLVGGKQERAVTECEEEEEEREEEFGSATSSSPSSMAEWLYSRFLVRFRLLVITTRGLPVLPTRFVDGEGEREGRGECLGLCEEDVRGVCWLGL